MFIKTPAHREPRDWRASVALIASIFGSIAMTCFSGMLVYIMWKGGWPVETAEARVHVLGKALMLSLTGSLVVLTTLGFAINRRTIKVGRDGFEASGGGDDDTPAPPPVVTTTTTTAVAVPPTPTPAPVPAPGEPDLLPDPDPVQLGHRPRG
jgi:hypothetical protein